MRIGNVCCFRIIIIIDCYKSYSQLWKYFLNIPINIYMLSTESRQVFYNDTVDFLIFNCFEHCLKTRTLKINTWKTIIFKCLNNSNIRRRFHIAINQNWLIYNRFTFSLISVLNTKTKVLGCYPDIFLHKKHSYPKILPKQNP